MKKILILGCLILLNILSYSQTLASYYGKNLHGKRTASGEIFSIYKYTAAHKTLKFGSRVLVTNLDNNKQIIVTINDRGPFHKDRELDLSEIAFKALSDLKKGVIRIKYEILE